jgi:hypothetical protein
MENKGEDYKKEKENAYKVSLGINSSDRQKEKARKFAERYGRVGKLDDLPLITPALGKNAVIQAQNPLRSRPTILGVTSGVEPIHSKRYIRRAAQLSDHYCPDCKGITTLSFECGNPACPNQPCCGQAKPECKCYEEIKTC